MAVITALLGAIGSWFGGWRTESSNGDSVPRDDRSGSLYAFSPDRPTEVDRLGHEPLVDGIVRVLNDPGTGFPLTVAIAGRWGAGKSSTMLQLRRGLAAGDGGQRWLPVWFDAWRHQGRDALWVGLARAMYRAGQADSGGFLRRAWFRVRLERRRVGVAKLVCGGCVVLVGLAYLCRAVAEGLRGSSDWWLLSGSGAAAAAVAVSAAYLGVITAPFERAVARASGTRRYDDALGITDAAERDVECLIDTLTGRGKRTVVVFLDDLDRCQPGVIVEALATVTEIFSRREDQSIVFVLGVDMDVVVGAIESSLEEVRRSIDQFDPRRAANIGRDFLERIFQLTVVLDGVGSPPVGRLLVGESQASVDVAVVDAMVRRLKGIDLANPGELTEVRRSAGLNTLDVAGNVRELRIAVRERRADLLSINSEQVRNAELQIVSVLRLSPRALKRFDNTYRLQLQVSNGTPGCQLHYGPDELLALAKWVALRLFFGRVSSILDREFGLLPDLERLARRTDGGAEFGALLTRVAGELSPSEVTELLALLSTGGPSTSVSQLPFDSFSTTV